MYEHLKGKKLLLLGGIPHAIEIVKAAHEMGVEIYVTDYFETSLCKDMADKSFNISTTDIDSVVKLCKEEKIDGVITGFIDSMLPYCEKICKQLGFPFWGNQEQIQICINKKSFKDICRYYDVPLADEYLIECNDDKIINTEILKDIKYPVIVKPVDNSGSRGVYVCKEENELLENYKMSLSFSKSNTVIVEQCLKGQHVNMYYTIIDGEIYLSAMADRYVDYLDGKSAPLPVCLVHPSRFLNDYMIYTDKKIRNMFKGLGMKNGVAFVQGFKCDDGAFKIYEMGYRLNGGATYSLIESCCGYNQLKMLINFSLTGQMGNEELLKVSTPRFDKYAINFVLSVEGGQIGKIEGLNNIEKLENVVNIVQVKYEGDKIQGNGGSAQVIAYILFTVDNETQIFETLETIYSNIKVTDFDGNELRIIRFHKEDYYE